MLRSVYKWLPKLSLYNEFGEYFQIIPKKNVLGNSSGQSGPTHIGLD